MHCARDFTEQSGAEQNSSAEGARAHRENGSSKLSGKRNWIWTDLWIVI